MDSHVRSLLVACTGAEDVERAGSLQSLWRGYGSIDRYRLTGGAKGSVIVKHVRFPGVADNGDGYPREQAGNLSDRRKRRSYEVETQWYRQWATQCDDACRVPRCLGATGDEDEVLIVLEDLAAEGFVPVRRQVSMDHVQRCLYWLAHFHAQFMGRQPAGLWPVGTYWHLETRPDEWQVMNDHDLKQAAHWLDETLSQAPYPTLVHGDAKLANFLFSRSGQCVAAVDFQYVGGGCAMKDLAYFVSSCFDEGDCERYEARLLDDYFTALKSALRARRPDIADVADVERALRPLYPVAWTDFYRFLDGWSPGHWKVHGYSARLARQVLASIPG